MNDCELIWEAYNNIGIHIRDKVKGKVYDFTGKILRGEKTIETRPKPTLSPYIGQRVGIISTGTSKGKPAKSYLVGSAIIGEPIVYHNEEEFDSDYNKHLVGKDDKDFYIKTGKVKYGYPMLDVKRIEPVELTTPTDRKSAGFNVIRRRIDYDL
jgi:hypothetical protein